jgi:hypothetical protein
MSFDYNELLINGYWIFYFGGIAIFKFYVFCEIWREMWIFAGIIDE